MDFLLSTPKPEIVGMYYEMHGHDVEFVVSCCLLLFYWMVPSFRSCVRPWHDALVGLKAYLNKNKSAGSILE